MTNVAINRLVILWFLVAIVGVFLWIRKRKTWNIKVMLLILVFLLLFIARTAVTIYEPIPGEETYSGNLSIIEIILSGIVHTLQSFSMDEDYAHYVIAGKQMIEQLYGPGYGSVYGLLISILNVCAPIIGGAVLLDLLTGLFPWFEVYRHPKRRKIVFADLNEKSITMAEDIVKQNYNTLKPLLIFADTYADNSMENKSELFQRAKEINAICLKSPVYSLKLKHSESVSYVLIDTDDYSNTSALSKLLITDEDMWPKGKEILNSRTKDVEQISDNSGNKRTEIYRTRIYYICHIEKTVEIVNTIYNKSESKNECLIRTINDYSHVAVNLMQDVPLFIPFLKEETNNTFAYHIETDERGRTGSLEPAQHLHVTLLGSGSMAEELFKAVFWCGQMYDIQLHLHVVSLDAENMIRKLKSECPEVFKTSLVEGGTQYQIFDKDLLRTYPHTDSPLHNPPYAHIEYIDNINLENITEVPEEIINNTDYYIVVLGEDQKNFNVSKLLKRELAKRILDNKLSKSPVIAVSIYDDDLADVISDADDRESETSRRPYIIPFGTLKSRFSCSNILFTKIFGHAMESAKLYSISEQDKYFKDEYTYWANNAKTIHAVYKLFALNRVKTYILPNKKESGIYGINTGELKSDEKLVFSWMEKRRWNAFLRTQGFCCATAQQHENYYKELHSHKDLKRKLHNCLIEKGFNDFPVLTAYPHDYADMDALDMVTIKKYELDIPDIEKRSYINLAHEDYKPYDGIDDDSYAKELLGID